MPALNTLRNIGDLYAKQAEIAKAQAIYSTALSRLCSVFSQSSERCMALAAKIDALPISRGKREEQKLLTVGKGSALQQGEKKRARDS